MFSHWKIDKNNPKKLYIQAADIIIKDIESGRLKENHRLPSQRQLCRIFGVSRNTIISAVDDLSARGYIEIRAQSGIFVKHDSSKNPKSVKPDWNRYFHTSMHKYGNQVRIEQLTSSSRRSDIINISAAGLGKDFNFLSDFLPEIISSISREDTGSANHFNKYGNDELRNLIAGRISQQGRKISKDNILIIPSVLQGINLTSVSFLSFASNFIYATPNVINMDSIVHYTGVNMAGIEQDSEGICIDKVNRQFLMRNSMIYLNSSYHNPTGVTMSMERRKSVLKKANAYSVPIMEVDSMRDIWVNKPLPPSLFSIDNTDSVIYFGSLLRTLTLNLGISWIAAPVEVIEKLSDVKAQHDIYPSILLQYIVIKLFSTGLYDEYLVRVREIIARKKKLAFELLEKYFSDTAFWDKNNSDFYIWLEMNHVNTKKLYERTSNVLFYPGFFFDKRDTSHISICPSACSDSELEEGIKRLSQNIKSM